MLKLGKMPWLALWYNGQTRQNAWNRKKTLDLDRMECVILIY